DKGDVVFQKNTRVALLGQDVPDGLTGTVREVVSEHVPIVQTGPDVVDVVLTRMGLDAEVGFQTLSVGLKRRTLLARALAAQPDVLLLDEPTNHLDIEAITWLESFLLKQRSALFFVTHDRMFTQRLATRILELDRGNVSSWACNYQTYLQRREAQLEAEDAAQAQFDRKLAEEEAWIRQGIRARRTRNEGRVRALKQMRTERQRRRSDVGTVRVSAQTAEKTSRLVIEAEDVSFSYEDKTVIDQFSTTVLRGDKIGLIGPNGAGKTTLLRLLLGELESQSGTVKHGMRLQVAYFDQLRAQLDDNKTVFDTVANGSDRVTFNGRTKHVFAYLQDFLFDPARSRSLVKVLSGGERNRLLLAKLFTLPANVLALDEPTNDLDTETLDVLESILVEFSGTVLLVSHDRVFLNNVVTSTIVFENGGVREYVGGYDEWLRQRPPLPEELATGKAKKESRKREPVRKLSYKENRELEALPVQIDTLEAEQETLHQTMSDPAVYQDGTDIGVLKKKLETVETNLKTAYDRWEVLEAIREGGNVENK
ncbi:MAG: ATP-binding cassette domain-containing protein, partial [Candidatus Latescibacteria bacterium]|nr:ATP-binding cassette domain-containing protein [Candidatus Latescibacterota bacterium]